MRITAIMTRAFGFTVPLPSSRPGAGFRLARFMAWALLFAVVGAQVVFSGFITYFFNHDLLSQMSPQTPWSEWVRDPQKTVISLITTLLMGAPLTLLFLGLALRLHGLRWWPRVTASGHLDFSCADSA